MCLLPLIMAINRKVGLKKAAIMPELHRFYRQKSAKPCHFQRACAQQIVYSQ